MGSSPQPTPSLEDRILALEKQIIPVAAAAAPGKISTRTAGFLTAVATGVGYLISSQILTPAQSAIATLVVAGISAFVTAEET